MLAVLTAARWLHEASLMGLFGSAVLLMLLHARLPALPPPPLRAWRMGAAVLALAGAVAWFALATGQMAGDPAAMTDPSTLWLAAGHTLFGKMFLARLVLLLSLCAGLAWRWHDRFIAPIAAAALVLISVTSHAAQASPAHFTGIGIVSDGLHLLTGGFWIGSLFVLAAMFARGTRGGQMARALGIFAEWGMIAVALLVMTGIINAAIVLLGGEGHDTTLYLGVLGSKLVLVLAMVILALDNHFRLLPRLLQGDAARHLRGNVHWELGLGLAVVMLAALLGLLPPTL